MREGGLGAVGGNRAAGDQLLIARGGQGDHADDAAGHRDGPQNTFQLRGAAGGNQRGDDEEGGPHD